MHSTDIEAHPVGAQMVSIGGGVNDWLESPDSGPEGWASISP